MRKTQEEICELNVKLLLACRNNNFLKAKEAIENGADVNFKFPIKSEGKGFNTETYKMPLLISIEPDHEKIVELLLKNNANPNVRDHNNRTPLMYSCGKGLLLTSELLVQYKANINAINEHGREIFDWSPLTWGIRSHVPKIVYFLLEKEVIVDKRAYEFAKSEKCICTDRNYMNAKMILEFIQKYIITHPIKK